MFKNGQIVLRHFFSKIQITNLLSLWRQEKLTIDRMTKLIVALALKKQYEKTKKMSVHVETIGLQKDSVRRALKYIIPCIGKDLHGIELRLVTVWTHLSDDNMDSQISSNIKTHEIGSFNNIYNLMTIGSEIALSKLIMDFRIEDGEIFAITMARNMKNIMEV